MCKHITVAQHKQHLCEGRFRRRMLKKVKGVQSILCMCVCGGVCLCMGWVVYVCFFVLFLKNITAMTTHAVQPFFFFFNPLLLCLFMFA